MDTLTLRFDGASSVAAAREAMRRGGRVDIGLPLETHHALYRHLNPDAPGGPDEDIDAEDGAELLQRIATVAGLEELGALAPALKAGGYRVELSGPEPLLSLLPPAGRATATAATRRSLRRYIAENVYSRCGQVVTRLAESGLIARPEMPESETEIREWWLVSPQLGRALHDAGQPVVQFCELWMWGRTQGEARLEDDPEIRNAAR